MVKAKMFIDMDSTSINSIQAFCDTYNELYINHPDFVPADPDAVITWNAKEQIPLCKDINELFSHPLFFEFARPMDEWTIPVLEELSKTYELIICTIGVPENISRKAKYIAKWFPMIKESILMMQSDCKMDKRIVRMRSDTFNERSNVFIDDVASNLESSDADIKICFGKKYAWNADWKGYRAKTWKDVGNLFL
jgi:5'(3')-deoxyribonucleotidase